MNINYNDSCEYKGKIYFSSNDANGLFCMDLNRENVKLIERFDAPLESVRLHKKVFVYDDKLFFMPFYNTRCIIDIYCPKDRSFEQIRICKDTDFVPRSFDYVYDSDTMWIISREKDSPVHKFNLKDRTVTEETYEVLSKLSELDVKEYIEQEKEETEKRARELHKSVSELREDEPEKKPPETIIKYIGPLMRAIALTHNKIYIPVYKKNRLAVLDTVTHSSFLIEADETYEFELIMPVGQELWITLADSLNIVIYHTESDTFELLKRQEESEENASDFKEQPENLMANATDKATKKYSDRFEGYLYMAVYEERLYLISKTEEISCYLTDQKIKDDISLSYDVDKQQRALYGECYVDGHYMYLLPMIKGIGLRIDLDEQNVTAYHIKYIAEDVEKLQLEKGVRSQFEKYMSRGRIFENSTIDDTLDNYLYAISSSGCWKSVLKEDEKKIEHLKDNGKRIYQYIKSQYE